MNQVQVQILQLEVSQCLPEGRLHILGVVLSVPQLGSHKQLLPRYRLVQEAGPIMRRANGHPVLPTLTSGRGIRRELMPGPSPPPTHTPSPLRFLISSLCSPRPHLAGPHSLLQGLPNLSLVAVDSSTIDVAVAYAQRILNSCFYLPGERSIEDSALLVWARNCPAEGHWWREGARTYHCSHPCNGGETMEDGKGPDPQILCPHPTNLQDSFLPNNLSSAQQKTNNVFLATCSEDEYTDRGQKCKSWR